MLITRPRRAGGVTVCKWTLALDPNMMLNAPSSTSNGISTYHELANETANSNTLNPAAPMKMRFRETLPRLAMNSADTTDPTAIAEVNSPKLAGLAFSTYSATSG